MAVSPAAANDTARDVVNAAPPPAGVTWNKNKQKWQARITSGGKRRNLGVFDDEGEAARAYARASAAPSPQKRQRRSP